MWSPSHHKFHLFFKYFSFCFLNSLLPGVICQYWGGFQPDTSMILGMPQKKCKRPPSVSSESSTPNLWWTTPRPVASTSRGWSRFTSSSPATEDSACWQQYLRIPTVMRMAATQGQVRVQEGPLNTLPYSRERLEQNEDSRCRSADGTRLHLKSALNPGSRANRVQNPEHKGSLSPSVSGYASSPATSQLTDRNNEGLELLL